jgi:hypothetical protein
VYLFLQGHFCLDIQAEREVKTEGFRKVCCSEVSLAVPARPSGKGKTFGSKDGKVTGSELFAVSR